MIRMRKVWNQKTSRIPLKSYCTRRYCYIPFFQRDIGEAYDSEAHPVSLLVVTEEAYPSVAYSVIVEDCGVSEDAIPSDTLGITVDISRVSWEAFPIESYGVTVEVCGVSYCLMSYYVVLILLLPHWCCFVCTGRVVCVVPVIDTWSWFYLKTINYQLL